MSQHAPNWLCVRIRRALLEIGELVEDCPEKEEALVLLSHCERSAASPQLVRRKNLTSIVNELKRHGQKLSANRKPQAAEIRMIISTTLLSEKETLH